MLKSGASLLLCLAACAALSGCVSDPLNIDPPAPGTYEVIGKAEGKAGGILLFGVIPIGIGERFNDAYNRAVESRNGDALVDVSVADHWWWAGIFEGHTAIVRGTVVKLTGNPAAAPGATQPQPAATQKGGGGKNGAHKRRNSASDKGEDE